MEKFLCLKPKSFLICILFFTGIYYSTGQVNDNPLVFSDQQKLSQEEQLMVQKYLDDYDGMTDLGNGYPPIWDKPLPQLKPHGIIVALEANPRINDIPLDQYDYIGGFYTDDFGELRCGGAGYWPDTMGIVFALQRDNPLTPEKDGFSHLETIYFKLFTFSTMKDYEVDVVEFDPDYYGTNRWGSLGLSRIINIQALEYLDFYIQPSNNPICFGDEITLSAEEFVGSGGNYTFQWSSTPSGFNSNVQFPPPTTPLETTTYTLLVDDGIEISEHSLTIEVSQLPIVNAGPGGEVCANAVFQLNGNVQNFSSVIWTTNGDGDFDDPELLNALYTPGETDIINGEANLTLTANPLHPCDASFSNEVSITVLPIPVVSAGDDFIACTTQDVELFADVNYYNTVEWSTSGSGYFTEPNSLNTLYIAQGNDFENGVNLSVCAQSTGFCEATVCDIIHVGFVPGPTAFGMMSTTVCENNNVTVSGQAFNFSSTLWTTAGDGTFSNPGAFFSQYYPGPLDIENSGVIVSLNAFPIGNCDTAVNDVTVNIVNLPQITFGPNSGNICYGDDFLQIQSTVNYSNSIVWSTNGDGTFSNKHITNPKYFPGTQDQQNGQFELELFAYPLPYCSVNTIEPLLVTFQDNPVSSAGPDAQICKNQTHTLSQASASSYGQLFWSGGNGTFNNPYTLKPTYTPAPQDYGTTVTLCLEAAPISPCDLASSDCMNLYVERLPSTDAGPDTVICETDVLQLDGTVLFYDTFEWTTNGDGVFSDANTEDPSYTPGNNDIQIGSVTLTLTAQPKAPCAVIAVDEMQLDIQRTVTAAAGNDAVICDVDNHPLNSATAANYETLNWTTSGDGTFSNPSDEIHPIYYPGVGDINSGSVELTITATAISPCAQDIVDTKILSIVKSVVVDAGSNFGICETETHQLNGNVENELSFVWATSGDGLFSDASIENPVYTPGASDIQNGSVTLTLTAQPNAPCVANAEDAMQLDIQRAVTAGAGNDAVICDVDNHPLNSATAANYETLNWTTSGDGTFSNPSDEIHPIYYPGVGDINSGSVELTITATAISPCAQDIVDTKTLSIVKSVVVDAGSNFGICETETHQLNGNVENELSFVWATSGDGLFSDASIENPVYTPGSNDIAAETVTLTLTAQPNAPCQASASDGIILEISPSATLDIGEDIDVCATEPILLDDVVADDYASLLWTTSGDGTFNDPAMVNPLYYPGINDLALGSVELNITLSPISPCINEMIGSKNLSVAYPPIADAGDDIISCGGEVELNGTVENYNSFAWTTAGDGTFGNDASLTPVYFPGLADIENKQVELSLTANANLPCTVAAEDMMLINFDILTLSDDNVVDKEVVAGGMMFLSFSVSSLSQGQYSWYFNGEIIPGQNNPMLLLTDMQPMNAGYYQGQCVNNCGMVETNVAFIEVLQPFTHEIVIPQGWSGLSSYVTPDNPALETVFQAISDKVELMANNDGIYWPGQNINTLGDLEVTDGYQIIMTESTALSVTGNIRYPLNELVLSPGWSYLPVNTNCAVDIENQFADLGQITMIKEIAGTGIYWPAQGINTIGQLQPGKAYFIFNESTSEVIIKYAACE